MWEWTESCWADFGCGVIHTISTVNDFTSIMLEEEESQSHKPAQDWTVKNPTSKCTKWTGWSLEKKSCDYLRSWRCSESRFLPSFLCHWNICGSLDENKSISALLENLKNFSFWANPVQCKELPLKRRNSISFACLSFNESGT